MDHLARPIAASLLVLAACSGDSGTSMTDTASTTTTTTTTTTTASTASTASTEQTAASSGSSSETSGTTDTTGGDPPPAAVCQGVGGICVPQGACAAASGAVPPESPGGCFFDDGTAECCVPPAAKDNPTTCAEAGGLCAPIGGCFDAGGALTTIDGGCDMGASYACCVPHSACGDATIECCDGAAAFRPACDLGEFVCTVGDAVPVGTCL
jgi:hypothetical protein